MSTDRTAESYNQMAETYENRWSGYLHHTHQRFLRQVKTKPDDVILDLSCGTGLLAQYLTNEACPFQKLILNDIAKKMQQKAKKRFRNQDKITFTNFSANTLGFENKMFDKIFCLNAFHNYNEQSRVLAESYRVLKPGGQLFILDWNRSGLFLLKNWIIKMMVPERIDTKSTREITSLLLKQNFEITAVNEWNHRSWKFYSVIGKKL